MVLSTFVWETKQTSELTKIKWICKEIDDNLAVRNGVKIALCSQPSCFSVSIDFYHETSLFMM